jgi:hypothetical protein
MENKTGKYFKYAIGEIILVVIGILIALSINNWNENRKERNSEKILLSNLNEEFSFNLNELKDTEVRLNQVIKKAKELVNLFGTDKNLITTKHIDSLIYGGIWGPTFDPNQDVFYSVYDKGNMELISNANLKKTLISWGSTINEFKEAELNMKTNLNRNVVPKLEKIISFRNAEKFGTLKGIDDSRLLPDNRVMLENIEAENIIFNHLWELENTISYYSELSSSIENIISQLENK